MIDSDDRESMRAYIEAADRYFRELEHPTRLFAKPYVPLAHAGYNVVRLGYLLHHLQITPAHTVLDFGAGMGWLTIALLKTGCRVVALDVSQAALDLAALAIREAGMPDGTSPAALLTYDGFRFPLPDGSVDRVACYDALHHVPNKRTVLREMFRVLRDGGRACFVEPGPGHSGSPDAVHDTDAWGVLEDEIDAAAFCAMAAETGFADSYAVPLPMPDDNRLAADAYARARLGPRERALDWSGNDALIVLAKAGAPDSRSPRALAASLDVLACPDVVEPGTVVEAQVRVSNTGDTRWIALPHEGLDYDRAFLAKAIARHGYANVEPVGAYRAFIEERHLQGTVTLGASLWHSDDGHLLDRDYARGFLPHDVDPGESAQVTVRMRAPMTPGRYCVTFDPVDEYVAWFSPHGDRTAAVYLIVGREPVGPDSRAQGVLQARIRAAERPRGGRVVLSIENTGDTVWLHRPLVGGGWVQVGVQQCDVHGIVVDREWRRLRLPRDVPPGGSVTVRLDVDDVASTPIVHVDLVCELRTWFAETGSEPLTLRLAE
jgi:SAM-dependent methyltransferase